MKKGLLIVLLCAIVLNSNAVERERISFNGNWLMQIGDVDEGQQPDFDNHLWQQITLPHAWNEDEAFRLTCAQLSDTVVWYHQKITKQK